MEVGESMKALVVENDPYWRDWFSASLERLRGDVSVHVADSIETAKRRLDENSDYDLIICDQFLEGKTTGLDFWKTLREGNSEIPFVLTSAHAGREPAGHNVYRIGVDGIDLPPYLDKGHAKEHFRRLVAQMIKRSHPCKNIDVMGEAKMGGMDQQLQQVVECFW